MKHPHFDMDCREVVEQGYTPDQRQVAWALSYEYGDVTRNRP